MSEVEELSCISLLKAMELEDYNNDMEFEEEVEEMEDQGSLNLPEEWVYSCREQFTGCQIIHAETQSEKEDGQTSETNKEERIQDNIFVEEELKILDGQSQNSTQEHVQVNQGKAKKKKAWGAIQPQRRSKRQPQDGMPVLERAQALRKKNNLEVPKGITHFSCQLSTQNLRDLASKVDLNIEEDKDRDSSCVEGILGEFIGRSALFSDNCSFANCVKKVVVDKPSSIVTRSKANQSLEKVTAGNNSMTQGAVKIQNKGVMVG